MKDKLAKVYPIITGIAIGWLLVYPPEWLAPLGALRYAAVVLLALALVLGAALVVILKNLPERLEVEPLDETPQGHEKLEALTARFSELGFTPVGPPYRVELSPSATMRGMLHQRLPIYAQIFRTGTLPAITTFGLVSIMTQERGGLTTTPEPRSVVLPAFPGSLRQALAGLSPEALLERHTEAMAMLEQRGLQWRHTTPSDLVGDMQRAIARHRRDFLRAPLRNTLIAIWRSATSRYPEARPLAEQRNLEARIEEILSGTTIDTVDTIGTTG